MVKIQMKQLFSKRWNLRWYGTLVCLLGCALAIVFTETALQAGSIVTTFENFLRRPLLLCLNLLPIAVALGVFYALFGNAFYAGALTSAIFNVMSLVNLIKIECRNDPLIPADFGLLKEALQATEAYQLNLHVPYIIAIAVMALVLALLGVFFKSARPRPLWRAGIAAIALAGFGLAMGFAYPNTAIYEGFIASVPGIRHYDIPNVFDHLGFNYCFLRNFNLYAVEKPEGYDKDEAAAWAAATNEQENAGPLAVRPNVLFVQCEAFSDIFASDVFTYSREENPLAGYWQVAESDHAVSGHIIVSNYGAGTANTEFDVITGMQTNLISSAQTSAFRVIHKNTSSLARVFAADGYQTYFMHPGYNWFYNRESVYDYLGIPETVFENAFTKADRKGKMTSDEAFLRQLLADFEARTQASDDPLFAFTVTIQNHQSYPYTKYDFPVEPVQTSLNLSDGAMETLSVYAQGIRDSSQMLLELTEYLDASQEPTLVIFWGDHLPALGSNFSVYHELGLDIGYETTMEGTLNTYQTPFILWANDAYCQQADFAAQVASLGLPESGQLTSSYLGGLVYDLLGMDGRDAFFDYLSDLRAELPVMCRGVYLLPDGTLTRTLTPEQEEMVEKLHKWQYYRLKDERVSP